MLLLVSYSRSHHTSHVCGKHATCGATQLPLTSRTSLLSLVHPWVLKRKRGRRTAFWVDFHELHDQVLGFL